MSVIANPYTDPAAWRQFIVGGSAMPGILTALGLPDREYEYAIQMGYGSTQVVIYRATKIIDGIEVVHFLRPTTANDPGDWPLWEAWMKSMVKGWPVQFTGKPPAYPIVHPMAQVVGLTKANLKSYGAPFQMVAGDPSYWYKVRFVEYAPQKKIPTGPTEPAQINGRPTPRNWMEGVVDRALDTFAGPRQPIPTATASGSVT